MTYTYAILLVSQATYDEIKAKLVAAEYQQAFHDDHAYADERTQTHEDGPVIDMHGIALQADTERTP